MTFAVWLERLQDGLFGDRRAVVCTAERGGNYHSRRKHLDCLKVLDVRSVSGHVRKWSAEKHLCGWVLMLEESTESERKIRCSSASTIKPIGLDQ